MPNATIAEIVDWPSLEEAELVARAQQGECEAFRHLMQRNNQRLFRVARGVVRDDAEAEDVVQEAYVLAFARLSTFRGDAALSTWLTRIVLNEAYARLRRQRPSVDIEALAQCAPGDHRVVAFPSRFGSEDPAAAASRAQVRRLLEDAIDALPEAFRIVFVMRDVEGCSVEETASLLDIRPETVKTRLHRARRMLRGALQDSLAATLGDAFPFLGPRCARTTEAVLVRLDAVRTASAAPGTPTAPQ